MDLHTIEGQLNEARKLAIQQVVNFNYLNKEYRELETANELTRHHLVQIQTALTKSKDQLSKAQASTSASLKQVRYLRVARKHASESITLLGNSNRQLKGQLLEKETELTKCEKTIAALRSHVDILSNAPKLAQPSLPSTNFLCNFIGLTTGTKVCVPSVRTVRRFIKEREVVSRIQLGEKIRQTVGFTTGGDGTTNKSQNFDSFHLNFSLLKDASSEASSSSETVRHVHFGNLRMEANHRAETQMNGDIEFMQNFIDLYNKSPLGQRNTVLTLDTLNALLSIKTATLKYHGSHSDHAEDQKAKHRLLATWKESVSLHGLGARHFFSLPEDQREAFICKGREKMIKELGGESAWQALTPKEQAEKNLALTGNLADELAGEALLSLSEEE
ncbi:hypothetical protein ACEPAG_4756 [Sanghuangporus baumii]